MKKTKICIIPLGQSPRPDFVAPIAEAVGESAEIIEHGAMNGLSYDEIMALDRSPDDYLVGTNLPPDGKRVTFPKKHVLSRMQGILNQLEDQGVDIVAVCCSEPWPEYSFKGLWIEAQRLMYNLVSALNIKGPGIVVFPQEDQREMAMDRWKGIEGLNTFKMLSPAYGDDELKEFLDFLVESAPSYVVLDCFGFNQKLKKIIKEKMNNIPVILAPTVLANSLREIVLA